MRPSMLACNPYGWLLGWGCSGGQGVGGPGGGGGGGSPVTDRVPDHSSPHVEVGDGWSINQTLIIRPIYGARPLNVCGRTGR